MYGTASKEGLTENGFDSALRVLSIVMYCIFCFDGVSLMLDNGVELGR